ncbi:MAG: nuclease-related domain-containing protein, partial [Solirubrobacteraceae bacterium]
DGGCVSGTRESRELRLRRPDRCAMCRVKIPAGVRATWHPARRVVTCLTCSVKVGARGLDTPGASARREYERRHAAREDRARQKLGLLGVVLARTVDEPQSTRAWKTGADGEERVGKRLAKLLAGTEARLLHDRLIPGHGAANIDHLAVGPGGITVIDTKNYGGKVRTEQIGGLSSERRTG